jgi:hypothetical protein
MWRSLVRVNRSFDSRLFDEELNSQKEGLEGLEDLNPQALKTFKRFSSRYNS